MAAALRKWSTKSYVDQEKQWPKSGKHILSQYDHETVVVYQAFNEEISKYAVKNQRFGGEFYSFGRMSWIKTNFLWMMYRCGWAQKDKNQTHVLAIRIYRGAFEKILSEAYTSQFQKEQGLENKDVSVRLQWDPDHNPHGEACELRAIQLGLRGEMLRWFATECIVSIDDITPFVLEQHALLLSKGVGALMIAEEHVYPISDQSIAARIGLDNNPLELVN